MKQNTQIENAYSRHTAKFISTLIQNVPEMSQQTMQSWIENPKGLQGALVEALCPSIDTSKFEVFKTIKVGTGLKTAEDFLGALKQGGYNLVINKDEANLRRMLESKEFADSVSDTEREVDLVFAPQSDLDIKFESSHYDVCRRAKEIGLQLCTAEVGIQLRLQWPEQKLSNHYIGMRPINGRTLNIFNTKEQKGDIGINTADDVNEEVERWCQGPWIFIKPR